MRVSSFFYLIVINILFSLPAHSKEINIPLNLDYWLVEQALMASVFVGPDKSANYKMDPQGCNSITLTNPEVGSGGNGTIAVKADMSMKAGTPLAGSCLMPVQWRGKLDVVEKIHVLPGTARVAFTIVDANFKSHDNQKGAAPEFIWQNLKSLLLPQLGSVTLDLNVLVTEIQTVIATAVSSPDLPPLPPLRLTDIGATERGLTGTVTLDVPDMPPEFSTQDQAPLSAEELAQWDANWQAWDSFATWLIKSMAGTASDTLRQALATTLLEARYDLRSALVKRDAFNDPVRELFSKTWNRLAPLLTEDQLQLPGSQSLSFAAFMGAAEALDLIDSLAPQLGLRLDSQTLRSLARLWMPAVQPDDLAYTITVDPQLRALLGFDPEFPSEETLPQSPLAWLVPQAQALSIDPALLTKLTGWVPVAADLDKYLATMQRLLDQIVATEKEKGKVPVDYIDVYENLVLATAWQESCWRQFEKRDGSVRPLLSSAGSVGLMQVNKHVWRGVYDPIMLDTNVGYNARAGNEILVHYLVDYAIKQKEDVISGDKHNLARATYGVYNGGPRHISRYRKADTKPALAKIDQAFWKKYQAIRKQGHGVVKSCYGS